MLQLTWFDIALATLAIEAAIEAGDEVALGFVALLLLFELFRENVDVLLFAVVVVVVMLVVVVVLLLLLLLLLWLCLRFSFRWTFSTCRLTLYLLANIFVQPGELHLYKIKIKLNKTFLPFKIF